MRKVVLLVIATVLLSACNQQCKQTNECNTKEIMSVENNQTLPQAQDGDVFAGINLTVAESKRLIAKGIVNYAPVKEKLKKGMVIVTSGTTNTYIAEELVGLDAPRGSFMTGNITPQSRGNVAEGLTRVPNITLVDGKPIDIDYEEALKQFQEGDIIFKGANLLNYAKKQAAVCIGAPDGGTTSRVRAYTTEGKGKLIVPIGLEKETSGDLNEYEKLLENKVEQLSYVPRVWMHQNAEIFTEIEAIKTFAPVNVAPYAAGGIAGREGGISLFVYGTKENVQKVLDVIATIQGEEPFVK